MRKRIEIIFLVFIATFFCYSLDVHAAVKGEGTSAYCILCDETNSDSYKWEQQFKERIKIIKLIYGDRINEVALAATVLHKENALAAVQSRYEENFDSDAYAESLDEIQNNHTPINGNVKTEEDLKREAESNAGMQIDLLNAAALVMAESSGWDNGQYNEDNYKKALAGDKLFGNDDGPFSDLYNGIYCGLGGAADLVFTGLNITNQFLTGQDIMTETERSSKRFHNMASICLNGYIGGVYDINETTVPDEEVRHLKKERIADEIIDLIHYYCDLSGECGEENEEDACVDTTTGDFANWKQCGASWSSINLLGGDSICSIGCLATSMAIQIARSGTKVVNVKGEFNPGAFVQTLNKNDGFVGGGLYWAKPSTVAPNYKYADFHSIGSGNKATVAKALSKELSTAAEGKYQKYIVLQIHHNGSSQHWVALDSVSGSNFTIFDPGASGNTLDQNYTGWVVDGYSLFYFTDVLNGKSGSSTSGACGGNANLNDLMDFIAFVEGTNTCNYKGKGANTGYAAEDLNDGAGMTTAFGITQNYSSDYAKQVGYSSFQEDISSGCTDKTYIDKIYPLEVKHYLDIVKKDMSGVSLTDYQLYILVSIIYNTGASGSYVDIADKIKKYGVDSVEVFNCMKTKGCSWTADNYDDGLVRRRMAEYEVLKTGNFNADKPSEGYAYFTTVDWKKYMQTHWPSHRK